MRRLFPFLIVTVLVMACSDTPQEPTIASGDLHARLTSPPDLSGILPELERRVFIHYRPGYARPEGRGKPGGGNGGSSCFSLLGKGAKWKAIEPYRTSVSPLPVTTWEFEEGIDIFGASVPGNIPEFSGDLDELNTAQFGPYPNPDVIAVTVVWGVFIGPPRGRELVEWDILFNDAFDWGTVRPGPDLPIMDTENIAAHELGHAAGLGHPPDECTEETMYAFAELRETKKRTLEPGDEAGIHELY